MPRRPVRPGCDPTREGRMRLFGRSAPRRPAARLCVAPLSGRCERFRTFSKPIARSATCLADYSVDRGLGRRMVLVARRRKPPDAFLRYDTHAALIARGGAGKRQARGEKQNHRAHATHRPVGLQAVGGARHVGQALSTRFCRASFAGLMNQLTGTAERCGTS